MSPEPRYVFDNSAVVSALLFEESVRGQAFYAALDHGEIVVSPTTFAELSEVLGREKKRKSSSSDRMRSEKTLAEKIETTKMTHVGSQMFHRTGGPFPRICGLDT